MGKMLLKLYRDSGIEGYQPRVTAMSYDFEGKYNNFSALRYSVMGADGKTYNVFAFMGLPEGNAPAGGFPAVVLVHGGGGNAAHEWIKRWTDRGYAAIAPDFDAQYAADEANRTLANAEGGPKGYGSVNDTGNPQSSWLFFSVFSIGCAYNVIASHPKIDKSSIALAGISWGGFVSLTAAAADNRFCALSVIYSSGFITDTVWGIDKGFGDDTAKINLYNDLFDPQGYLEYIKMPTLFAAGTDDAAFTVYNRKRTSDKITAQKYFSYRRLFPHGHIEGWNTLEAVSFCDKVIQKKPLPVEFLELSFSDYKLTYSILGDISSIKLVYTTDDYTKKEFCDWQQRDIHLSADSIEIEPNTSLFFLQGTDKSGRTFSTDYMTV